MTDTERLEVMVYNGWVIEWQENYSPDSREYWVENSFNHWQQSEGFADWRDAIDDAVARLSVKD